MCGHNIAVSSSQANDKHTIVRPRKCTQQLCDETAPRRVLGTTGDHWGPLGTTGDRLGVVADGADGGGRWRTVRRRSWRR